MSGKPEIPNSWTEQERWVWERIQQGQNADFNERDREEDSTFKDLDPKEKKGWGDSRRLRVSFLQTILTKKSFVDATPFKGVKILGTLIDDVTLDLAHARLEKLFWLEKSRLLVDVECRDMRVDGEFSLEGSYVHGAISFYEAQVDGNLFLSLGLFMEKIDLNIAKITGHINMNGSILQGKLNMNGTEVGQSLIMSEKANFKEVDMTAANIGGQLSMSGSTFHGKLNMSSTIVCQYLIMRGEASFQDVILSNAKIIGQLLMTGSTFHGMLEMNSTEVGQSLFMRDKVTFKDVALMAAKIVGHVDMSGSIIKCNLKMDGTEIGQSLIARATQFPIDQKVVFNFLRIGLLLDLSGANVGTIDLTGTTVKGELRLGSGEGHEPTNWIQPSRMVLRNVSVGTIQDAAEGTECWPEHLELEGFTYERLGGFGSTETANIAKRSSAWFNKWLMRSQVYSPQPYEQLAKVLREIGYPGKADTVLFESKKRAQQKAMEDGERWRWLGMCLLRCTIGFGLGRRYFFSVAWVIFFTMIGVIFFTKSMCPEQLDVPAGMVGEPLPHCKNISLPETLASETQKLKKWDLYDLSWASLDQLLPIIKLNKAHDKIASADSLPRRALYYFYFQKLVGWILGSFLVAGLAGLTQKN